MIVYCFLKIDSEISIITLLNIKKNQTNKSIKLDLKNDILMLFLVELNKTNEVKFWLTNLFNQTGDFVYGDYSYNVEELK